MIYRNAWTVAEAVTMCCAVESICPKFGYHVALTGGLLYKDNAVPRKDLDLVFYRIRQWPGAHQRATQYKGQVALLEEFKKTLGFFMVPLAHKDGYPAGGWRVVAKTHEGRTIDLLFPENLW